MLYLLAFGCKFSILLNDLTHFCILTLNDLTHSNNIKHLLCIIRNLLCNIMVYMHTSRKHLSAGGSPDTAVDLGVQGTWRRSGGGLEFQRILKTLITKKTHEFSETQFYHGSLLVFEPFLLFAKCRVTGFGVDLGAPNLVKQH